VDAVFIQTSWPHAKSISLNLPAFALVERIFLRQYVPVETRKLAQSNFQHFFEARQVARRWS
jgi:hypothetical protein